MRDLKALCGAALELASEAGLFVSLQFSHSNSTPVRWLEGAISDLFAIIREHCRFEALLGFQFGTRPLVFSAPKAGNGHLMGAFGNV